MSFDIYVSVPLPHGAVGWSNACDCGVSYSSHTHLLDHVICLVQIVSTIRTALL